MRQRNYVPAWWEKRFPWLLDALAALDPDPLLARCGRLGRPLVLTVETCCLPLAAGLGALGRGLRAARARAMDRLARALTALPLPRPLRRRLWIEPPRLRHPSDDVHLALKREYGSVLPSAMAAAVVLHGLVLALAPPVELAVPPERPHEELVALELPPDVRIPAAPAAIARPAAPVVTATEVDRDITIPPTTFDAYVVPDIAPPPPPVAQNPARRSDTFAPVTVPARILNLEELHEVMMEEYPPRLRQAGIGGTVKVIAYLDAEGRVERVEVAEGSGHESLDAAALRVASRIRCSPAFNRDAAVSSWIGVPLQFVAR